jgi:hypothetical protein
LPKQSINSANPVAMQKISFTCRIISEDNIGSRTAVGKNVTHRASDFQKAQQLSTNGPQQVQ